MRTSLVVLFAAAVAVSGQQLPQVGGEQVYVTAIDVVADVRDAKGNLPPGLKPSDFSRLLQLQCRKKGVPCARLSC